MEAYFFARWLGGDLPSEGEWDKAAFGDPKRPGAEASDPFNSQHLWDEGGKDSTKIALRLEEPLPVGKATADRSRFGCRDMFGNGLEWTRELVAGRSAWPVDSPAEDLRFILRGQSFKDINPCRKELGRFPRREMAGLDRNWPLASFRG